MRESLAEKLLVRIMGWSPEEISVERPLIQALATFKYDEYQQFSPGTRFVESLAKWLGQFETREEQSLAYNFIKAQLVFISNEQILHLVNTAFTEKVNPLLIEKSAIAAGINKYFVRKIAASQEYKQVKRRSLFIGLSDGSRIDQLRRAGNLNNEQVLVAYETSDDKVNEMLAHLSDEKTVKFNTVFLVDDFTASGTSYFKADNGKWKGKIPKFLKSVYKSELHNKKGLGLLVDHTGGLDVHILFYIATREALDRITINIEEWKQAHPEYTVSIFLHAVQVIDDRAKQSILEDAPLLDLLKKYFDPKIVDSHYKKGKHDLPYLGFNECGLPLVLNHNTPNNSLPILWFPEDSSIKGLFPRVLRHRDE